METHGKFDGSFHDFPWKTARKTSTKLPSVAAVAAHLRSAPSGHAAWTWRPERSTGSPWCAQVGTFWWEWNQFLLGEGGEGDIKMIQYDLICFRCRASEEAPAVVSFWHYTKNNIIDEGGGGVGDNSVICCTFSCTCTHTSCYAAVRSHALAHIRHATLLYVLMHLHTYVMLRCCTFSCTCTHTSCYAAVRSHALAHIRHATPLYVLMHLHTYVMLRRCTFSCTCTHTSCYAAVRSHALAYIRHAYDMFILGSRRLPTLHLLHHPLLLGLFLVILDLYQNLWLINEKLITTFHVWEAMLQTMNQIECQQRSPTHQITIDA